MDRNESLLQQRGPPTSPICPSESAVILCDSANGSLAKGVDFEIMDINMPELIPAPQAPQNPQAPPGTLLPRFIVSINELWRSMFSPAFLYAVPIKIINNSPTTAATTQDKIPLFACFYRTRLAKRQVLCYDYDNKKKKHVLDLNKNFNKITIILDTIKNGEKQ